MDMNGLNIVKHERLIQPGDPEDAAASKLEWEETSNVLQNAVRSVNWPPDKDGFRIRPEPKGNGVKPLTEQFEQNIARQDGWVDTGRTHLKTLIDKYDLDVRGFKEQFDDWEDAASSPWFDAIRPLNGVLHAAEWETGNIASSHRSFNRLILGLKSGLVRRASIFVPTRNLYRYMTDRIGNFRELKPYFSIWRDSSNDVEDGMLDIYGFEHDETDKSVPLIAQGPDGMASA